MIERFITMHWFTEPMQWVVLMVAAHMMLNVQSQTTNVTGILGNRVTLKFTFPPDVKVKNNSHIVVHRNEKMSQKVAESTTDNRRYAFDPQPKSNSVLWNITSVMLNDSGCYSASVVSKIASKSNMVLLTIEEVNTTSTDPNGPGNDSTPEDEYREPNIDAQIVAIVVVSAVVFMAAVLPCLIWSLFGVKDAQEQQNQQSSNPIVQETASYASESAPSVVYSVLEFPKRASALSDNIPNDTEYANISYTTM